MTEVSVTRVALLLGSDVPELIVPLETRCGPKAVGVRTKLGWTVTGCLPGYIEDGESQLKLGGGPRTLDVKMTVMCSVLSKMKRC